MTAVSTILSEIGDLMSELNNQDIEHFTKDIVAAKKVFAVGSGRALLVLKCFAKRLSHCGIDVHVIGETTTPPVAAGDLLIVASCSGKTAIPLAVAAEARQIGARLWGVTACADNPIAEHCDRILEIPCSGFKQNDAKIVSAQPMNNLFEQALHIVLDAISWCVQEEKDVSDKQLCSRHANIE